MNLMRLDGEIYVCIQTVLTLSSFKVLEFDCFDKVKNDIAQLSYFYNVVACLTTANIEIVNMALWHLCMESLESTDLDANHGNPI